MSLIKFYRNAEDRYYVVCSQCCAVVSSDATMAEIADYCRAGIEVTCFDCDTESADIPPRHLLSIKDNYFLGIGNSVFIAEWLPHLTNPMIQRLQLHKISLTTYFDIKTGRGVAYSPLSSWSISPQQSVTTDKNEVFGGIDK